jgi:hypothetical protein
MDFVEYYNMYGISPVAQNMANPDSHFAKRRALLISLGIIPSFVKSMDIIEFGAAGGENTFYLATLDPKYIDIVEASIIGYSRAKQQLNQFNNVKIFLERFEDFNIDKAYDLVWAEACIPHNINPLKILTTVSSFTKLGGVFCVTNITGISSLSEIFRRIIYFKHFKNDHHGIEITPKIMKFYESQLLNLPAMTKSSEDWILDNIFQPFIGRDLLTTPDTILTLEDNFDYYSASPGFCIDTRWYKEVPTDTVSINQYALDQYYKSSLNQIDKRFDFQKNSIDAGIALDEIGKQAWKLALEIEIAASNNVNLDSCVNNFVILIEKLVFLIKDLSPQTVIAINEGINMITTSKLPTDCNNFSNWWGRGQQYLSLIRTKN